MALPLGLKKCIFTVLSLFYGYMVALAVLVGHIATGFKYCTKKDYSKRPAALDDPSIGTHHKIKVNNKIIHYVGKGNQEAKKIVFLHGFPDFWFTWKEQLKEFGGTNFYAVAIDLPGYGESTKPQEIESVSVDRVTLDVSKIIQGLVKGDEKIILVGHDWGACIAYYLAADYPNLVEKLVILNGPHPVHFRHHLETNLRQFLKSWYMLFFSLPWVPEWAFKSLDFLGLKLCYKKGSRKPIFSDQELLPWKYIFAQPGCLTSAINYYRANIGKTEAFSQGKKLRIRQPLLVIWGDNDKALSTDLATGVTKYVDNVRLRLVKDASHFVHLEKPKYISQLIKEFIEE